MNVQAEKNKIKDAATPRATTTRAIEILASQGIELDRRALWNWLNLSGRIKDYDAEIIAAYWQAIGERTEKFRKLAMPQKVRAIQAAKRLAAEAL